MSSFKRSNVKVFTSFNAPETTQWKQFGQVPVLVKEYGAIDYIHFSSVEPYYFAATSSARVQIYNPVTNGIHKSFNKFKETAYGGSFRKDGLLLCAGGAESIVRMFDVTTKNLLRRFTGHSAAVHRTFFTQDSVHIASFSDDKSVILWDVATEKQVIRFQEHTDYIRAGCVSPISPDIIISGGYENTIKMYDTRNKSVVCTLDHGSPVESLLFLPSGSIFISAGGKEVRVWDAFSRNMLTAFTQYHKTVTCMCYSSRGKRLITGSADRKIKVIDTSTYKVSYTMSYESPILGVGINEKEDKFVVGMANGLISIQTRNETGPPKREKKISHRYMSDTKAYYDTLVDSVVLPIQKDKLAKYEFALRKFQYSKALDLVMVHAVAFKTPAVVVTVFDELIRRKGLMSAISGRDSKQLITLLRFIIRYISIERYTRTLIEAADCIIDAYCDVIHSYSMQVKNLFKALRSTVRKEETITLELLQLRGRLELIFAATAE